MRVSLKSQIMTTVQLLKSLRKLTPIVFLQALLFIHFHVNGKQEIVSINLHASNKSRTLMQPSQLPPHVLMRVSRQMMTQPLAKSEKVDNCCQRSLAKEEPRKKLKKQLKLKKKPERRVKMKWLMRKKR